MSEKWVEGRWILRPELCGVSYIKPGMYEVGMQLPDDAYEVTLDNIQLNQLIPVLIKNGFIKPQLGENRTEDIKIIHRLIDLIK